MAKKCKACGGALEEAGYGKYRCLWCGSDYAEQDLVDKNVNNIDLEVFSLLSKARTAIELEYDFNASLKFSQSVLEKNPQSQEANWLAMLAENQIAYIQNERGKYTPTFLAPDGKPLPSSRYYKVLNSHYKAEADAIESLRLSTLDEFKKIKPYDVFISYKQHETGSESAETKEAVWARDIYTELKTNPKTKHLNIFFDQKCLADSNAGWEPHIYSAIRSSKCMILLGSSLENINSRWVKNEWKRFLAYKKRGEKKDIIVLGSDAVNPLLLDDSLQEKQMITNTSGRWLNEICNRVADLSRKPDKEEKEVPPKPEKPKKKVNKKVLAVIISVCIAAIFGTSLGVGLWYNGEMKEVRATQKLISYLPDFEITNYSLYEEYFDAAIESYESLSDWQKEKVENRNLLLKSVNGFNEYRIDKLRSAMGELSVENVRETDNLETSVTLYKKLTSGQRALLTSQEKYALEQYVYVYDVITKLFEMQDDVLNRYDELDGIKRIYLRIDPNYQALVYNYYLVQEFEIKYLSKPRYNQISSGMYFIDDWDNEMPFAYFYDIDTKYINATLSGNKVSITKNNNSAAGYSGVYSYLLFTIETTIAPHTEYTVTYSYSMYLKKIASSSSTLWTYIQLLYFGNENKTNEVALNRGWSEYAINKLAAQDSGDVAAKRANDSFSVKYSNDSDSNIVKKDYFLVCGGVDPGKAYHSGIEAYATVDCSIEIKSLTTSSNSLLNMDSQLKKQR